MTVAHLRTEWITRRRYVGYILVVSLLGGLTAGYLLGGEHTAAALATGGVTAGLLALPRLVATRTLFDERDYRIDERAARYTMYVVMAAGIGGLVGPIVLEQLGVLPLQGWALFTGVVCMGIVYLYVGVSLVLRYSA